MSECPSAGIDKALLKFASQGCKNLKMYRRNFSIFGAIYSAVFTDKDALSWCFQRGVRPLRRSSVGVFSSCLAGSTDGLVHASALKNKLPVFYA
jgi:hypothetical protein